MLAWIEAHPGLASWIQAFVGLLAILAALGIALLEGHRANRVARDAVAREEARQARAETRELNRLGILQTSAAALLALAHRRVHVAAELIAGNPHAGLIELVRTHLADLVSMEDQMLAFPAFDLGNARAADLVAQAIVALRGARIFLDFQLAELSKSFEARHEIVAKKLRDIADHLEEMLRLLEAELDDADADRRCPASA